MFFILISVVLYIKVEDYRQYCKKFKYSLTFYFVLTAETSLEY